MNFTKCISSGLLHLSYIGTIGLFILGLLSFLKWKKQPNYTRKSEKLDKAYSALTNLKYVIVTALVNGIIEDEPLLIDPSDKELAERALGRLESQKLILNEILNHYEQMELLNESTCATILLNAANCFIDLEDKLNSIISGFEDEEYLEHAKSWTGIGQSGDQTVVKYVQELVIQFRSEILNQTK